jgi:hypothetical protein
MFAPCLPASADNNRSQTKPSRALVRLVNRGSNTAWGATNFKLHQEAAMNDSI